MRNFIFIPLAALLLAGPLMAQDMEAMRKSSEDISLNSAAIKASASAQPDVKPSADQGLAGLVRALLKLLFSPNGDIEVAATPGEAPHVDGIMQDDQSEESYDAGASYTPLDPSEYQEAPAAQQAGQPQVQQSQQAFQEFLHPGRDAAASGVVPEDLKRKALAYFNANSGRITNKRYIGIVDFAQHSSKARFFILDMQSGGVRAIHVAHGRGSDPDGDGFATKFSNAPESKASSLGFYLTGPLYNGSHGRSMRLIGLSQTNSNVLARAVVVHESAYVQEASVLQGRSFGCLAVSTAEIRNVLAALNGGALIYAGLSNSDF